MPPRTAETPLGIALEALSRLPRGYDTTVHVVHRHRDGNAVIVKTADVVVRIGWNAPMNPRSEARTWETAAAVGMPVPILLSSGRQSDRDYMVSTRLPGHAEPRCPGVLRRAGELLAALHSQPATGFPEVLDARPRRLQRFPRAVAWARGRSWPRGRPVVHWIRLAENDWSNRRDTPTHGDFRTANLLSEGDRLSGVVDWSDARRASRECDLGHVDAASFADVLAGYDSVQRGSLDGRLLLGYVASRYCALAAAGVVTDARAEAAILGCEATIGRHHHELAMA